MDHSKTPPSLCSHSRHKKPFQWLIFRMDHLNGKTELLKQTHILKDHLNEKTELLKQTHIQMDFPFHWNGMVETNGAKKCQKTN